ncbi:TPA: ABC transporter permease, partial [Streptococcus agalactiae]
YYFLIPSIKIDLVLSFTATAISILGYSTIMGVIGAGGLGEYAYRFGYQEYDYPVMYLIIVLFIIYVFILQSLGYFIANRYSRK